MVFVNTAEYLYAVLGGVLLGIATSINYILRGKVTGMSGIVYGIVSWNKKELPEKLTVVGGMLLISGIFFDIFQYSQDYPQYGMIPFGPQSSITAGTSFVGFALAGLFVGFGTKLSNGCTSGHGLCGLARLSPRSLAAVCTFLFTAIAIGTIGYYFTLGALSDQALNPQIEINNMASANAFLAIGALLPVASYFLTHKTEDFSLKDYLIDQSIIFTTGIVFGLGLMISGMTRRLKIMRFLQLGADWDPSLLFVLASGVAVNLLTFNYMIRVQKKPIFGKQLFNPPGNHIDWKLIFGAFVFGLGWGIGCLCPGPFIMLCSVFTIQIQVVWGICLVLGMYLAHWFAQALEKKHHEVSNAAPLQHKEVLPEVKPPNRRSLEANINIAEGSEKAGDGAELMSPNIQLEPSKIVIARSEQSAEPDQR